MKVVVGLSGGVDSAVAALLCKQAGHEVEAIFMVNWDEDDTYCTARQDYQDASAAAQKIGIPFHKVNFSKTYWDNVFRRFLSEYSKGRTPNPDILCNKEVKFRAFLDYAIERGADALATGHYAGTRQSDGQHRLLRGKDGTKDQSYFLYAIDKQVIPKLLFPLQSMNKTEVREVAKAAGLHVYNKSDSTGICFIGERNFNAFLDQYLTAKPGEIRTESAKLIGEHKGLIHYTLGQRKGLGIGGVAGFDEQPWFVIEKDLPNNRLVVAQGLDHPALYHSGLSFSELNWLGQGESSTLRCTAKTRYRQADQACRVVVNDDGLTGSVYFDKPVRAITPGQSVVFYDNEICLGGAVIEHVKPE